MFGWLERLFASEQRGSDRAPEHHLTAIDTVLDQPEWGPRDVHDAADVAALLEASLPALTHLDLGSVGDEVEMLERLAATESFPELKELCLAGGPHRTSPGWDRIAEAPFSVYLHGTLVTPEYPKRTP